MNITNAVRIIKSKKIDFEVIEYKEEQVFTDGLEIIKYINDDPKKIFKTITLTNGKDYFVAMVDINSEIDLKLCAKAFNENDKSFLSIIVSISLTIGLIFLTL